jgi:hypothetical protein
MDPARRLILGVTAGDGAFTLPLDRRLRWLGLDDAERGALLEALGPDPLGSWLVALDTRFFFEDDPGKRVFQVTRLYPDPLEPGRRLAFYEAVARDPWPAAS